MRRIDIAEVSVGAGLLALAATVFVASARFGSGDDPLGPAFVPRVIAAGLVILAAITAYRGVTGAGPVTEKTTIPPQARSKLLIVLAAMFVFVMALQASEGLGIPVLGPPLIFALTYAFGGLSLKSMLIGFIIVEGTYGIFRYWFGLALPGSYWF